MNRNKNIPTTHVVFVGPQRDFLMGSISLLREVGFSRIVLVTGNVPKFSGEALVQKTTKALARDLGIFWPVTVVEVNKSSVMDAWMPQIRSSPSSMRNVRLVMRFF